MEAARDIDTRITKIYADLVTLEKMMHYRRNISDILRDALLGVNNPVIKQDIASQALTRWLNSAKKPNEDE